MSAAQIAHLTPEQVHSLNEKHGWFAYRDAQSDVSKAFAQDAITMHERIRAAAQDMLAALKRIEGLSDYEMSDGDGARRIAREAISKATGNPA